MVVRSEGDMPVILLSFFLPHIVPHPPRKLEAGIIEISGVDVL